MKHMQKKPYWEIQTTAEFSYGYQRCLFVDGFFIGYIGLSIRVLIVECRVVIFKFEDVV